MFSGFRSLGKINYFDSEEPSIDEPVHNVKFVEMFKGKKQFCTVETRALLVEALFTLQMME